MEGNSETMPKNFRKMISKDDYDHTGSMNDLEKISCRNSHSTLSILSRQEENSDLQELNNRLAESIDNVGKLKAETDDLRLQLKTCENNKTQGLQLFTNKVPTKRGGYLIIVFVARWHYLCCFRARPAPFPVGIMFKRLSRLIRRPTYIRSLTQHPI